MSRPPSAPPLQKHDPESAQQTQALIRRILCSHAPPATPLEELLPALTSSPEVDDQLYALIAIICRDFVLSWYSKITPDHAFVDELIAIIAHCTRAVEERLRKVDLEALLLDDVPIMLEAHVRDYRQSVEREGSALAPHLSVLDIFRNLQPHPALKRPPNSERLYLKLLSTSMIAILLPTEDLESDVLRCLVREILTSLVFGNLLDKLSEPFMIYEIITKLVQPLQETSLNTAISEKPTASKTTGSNKFMPPVDPPRPSPWPSRLEKAFAILSKISSFIYSFISGLNQAMLNPLPPRRRNRALLASALPSFISTYINLPVLHPWLPTTVQLLSKPFWSRKSRAGKLLDDLILHHIQISVSTSALLAQALRIARATVFPNGSLGSPRMYPSEVEKKAIRETTEQALVNAIPGCIRKLYFGNLGDGEARGIIGRLWLDVWAEKEINKTVIFRLLDLITGRVFPELLEKGGAEIRRTRLGALDGNGV